MRLLVPGFACCVLATGGLAQLYGGGYGYPASGNGNVIVVYPPPAPPPPVTVVVPAGNQQVSAPAVGQEEYPAAGQITYLIAFKSGVIRLVDQYWVNGSTLYYLTADHERKEAPVASVDRALSQRLNSERNVAFNLPAGEAKANVRPRVVRHTASVIRKRCCCVSK
jgi:hypothetical protein